MVKFTVDRIRSLMDNRANIRNVAVIAHVDHGKSTLTDTLIAAAGIIAQEDIGKRITDTHPEEQLKGITIKSTGISLYFETAQQAPYLINLIDSPGHVDFSSEVTAALRLTDGALVLVDCVEGAAVQTETVLRQALNERIKPVLAINKLDRAFLELQLDSEQMYQNFCNAINAVNSVISANSDDLIGDVTVYPERGTVAFTAGKQGWGFNLQKFARMYAKKWNVNEDRLVQRLWGDNYYDPETKKWTESCIGASGKVLKRGFCQFIIEPIQRVFDACMKDRSQLDSLLNSMDIRLNEEEQALLGKDLLKVVMQKWLPASEALLEMITTHLPSPTAAQKYRVENLYTGPMDDETAASIRNCDPEGPLVVFVSKMLPNKDRSRFLAFGRVFSGTVVKGQKVVVFGPNYVPGKKEDMYEGGTVQRVAVVMGKKMESFDSVPCGNTVALVGIDNYISKSCTVVSNPKSFPMANMKFSVAPVMRVAVRTKEAKDLPKLVDGMKWLNKTDTLVQCLVEPTGELVLGCVGELHLEITIKELQSFLNGIEVIVSSPIVMYHETVTATSKVCLSKSPNKFNRLYVQAEPIQDSLLTEIEGGLAKLDPKDRVRVLTDTFSWSPTEARNLWAFSATNLLVDTTRAIQYMHESRDSIVAAFNWVTKEGVLAEEPIRAARFNIVDAVLHSDAIHRGGGQLIPCARRVLYASQLTASPSLMEPVYLVEINCPVTAMGGVYSTLSHKRGTVIDTMQKGTLATVHGYLPVIECFGFAKILRENTSGQAFMQCFFDHWKVVEGDVMEEKSRANDVMMAIRKRKGLPMQVPDLSRYLDTL